MSEKITLKFIPGPKIGEVAKSLAMLFARPSVKRCEPMSAALSLNELETLEQGKAVELIFFAPTFTEGEYIVKNLFQKFALADMELSTSSTVGYGVSMKNRFLGSTERGASGPEREIREEMTPLFGNIFEDSTMRNSRLRPISFDNAILSKAIRDGVIKLIPFEANDTTSEDVAAPSPFSR